MLRPRQSFIPPRHRLSLRERSSPDQQVEFTASHVAEPGHSVTDYRCPVDYKLAIKTDEEGIESVVCELDGSRWGVSRDPEYVAKRQATRDQVVQRNLVMTPRA